MRRTVQQHETWQIVCCQKLRISLISGIIHGGVSQLRGGRVTLRWVCGTYAGFPQLSHCNSFLYMAGNGSKETFGDREKEMVLEFHGQHLFLINT